MAVSTQTHPDTAGRMADRLRSTVTGMAVNWDDFQVRASATYGYVQLADWIEKQLKAGNLQAGDRLPAQRELGELTGTSVELTGRAMALLRERGVIETSARGSYVRGLVDDDHTYGEDELPACRHDLHLGTVRAKAFMPWPVGMPVDAHMLPTVTLKDVMTAKVHADMAPGTPAGVRLCPMPGVDHARDRLEWHG